MSPGIVLRALWIELDQRSVEVPVDLLNEPAHRPRQRAGQARDVQHHEEQRLDDDRRRRRVEDDERQTLLRIASGRVRS